MEHRRWRISIPSEGVAGVITITVVLGSSAPIYADIQKGRVQGRALEEAHEMSIRPAMRYMQSEAV